MFTRLAVSCQRNTSCFDWASASMGKNKSNNVFLIVFVLGLHDQDSGNQFCFSVLY
jgi:hypothetical protein